ncbi:metallophosphoesterase family protein [Clostridium sp. DL1XJH146]
MKVAIFSDIHGNLEALQEVIKDIKSRGIEKIFCLGDLVGYGPYQNEVIEFITGEKIIIIGGNYDAAVAFNDINYIKDNEINRNFALPWAVNEVSENNKKILKTLPEKHTIDINGKTVKFVHGSTRKVNEYLLEDSQSANEVMEENDWDVLFCGHTHIPYIKKVKEKILVNVGSVGRPKNGTQNIYYAIMDTNNNDEINVEIVEIKHSNAKLIKGMEKRDFPQELITAYEQGK